MPLPSVQYPNDSRRGATRRPVDADSTLRTGGSVPMDATVSDLSESGVNVRVDARLAIGTPITIGLPGIGMLGAVVVRVSEGSYGCRFERPVPAHAVAKAFTAETVVYVEPVRPAAAAAKAPSPHWPGPARVAAYVLGATVPWAVLLLLLR